MNIKSVFVLFGILAFFQITPIPIRAETAPDTIESRLTVVSGIFQIIEIDDLNQILKAKIDAGETTVLIEDNPLGEDLTKFNGRLVEASGFFELNEKGQPIFFIKSIQSLTDAGEE